MKSAKLMLVMVLLLIFPSYSYSSDHYSSLGALYISLLDGDIQINTEDTGEWVPADTNMPMREGDRIWVPLGGRVELRWGDGTSIRLNEVSSLDILTLSRDSLQVHLAQGQMYVHFRGPQGGMMQVDTPLSSSRVYGKSVFRIDVVQDGDTDVSVFKGKVHAEDRNGRTTVMAGTSLMIRDASYSELAPLGPPDQWEKWNFDRDRELYESRYSSQYLPEDLGSYSHYFDTYGKWDYASDYGYVWRPTVISAGWAPYRLGRWVWIGGDYVWISHDPWGWVPHHYGRWVHIRPHGWCWVPPSRGSVYWGPGFVGWVYTRDSVAWVPLAPGDLYYGYGYYGPSSVNISNMNASKIVINKVYKNVRVNDAVTVVSRDTFITGSPARMVPGKNPFLTERISIGRPLIKPERPTMMPVIKEVPRANLPPRQISDLRVDELRHRRPLVREKNAPVLRPQMPQTTMPMKIYNEPKGSETRTLIEKEPTPLRRAQPQQKQPSAEKPQTTKKQREPAERQIQRSAEPREKRFTDENIKKQREPAGSAVQRPSAPPEQQRQVRPPDQQSERPGSPPEMHPRPADERIRRQRETGRPPAERPAPPAEKTKQQSLDRDSEKSPSPSERQPAERQFYDRHAASEGRTARPPQGAGGSDRERR